MYQLLHPCPRILGNQYSCIACNICLVKDRNLLGILSITCHHYLICTCYSQCHTVGTGLTSIGKVLCHLRMEGKIGIYLNLYGIIGNEDLCTERKLQTPLHV